MLRLRAVCGEEGMSERIDASWGGERGTREMMRGEGGTETYLDDGKDDDEAKGDCDPSL